MANFLYNADIGTFEIRQVSHLQYELWIGEELLGSYASAEDAANDVAAFDTGYDKWDTFENKLEHCPRTLADWAEVTPETPR